MTFNVPHCLVLVFRFLFLIWESLTLPYFLDIECPKNMWVLKGFELGRVGDSEWESLTLPYSMWEG